METRRQWFGFALGLGLAGWMGRPHWRRPGPVAVWVADAGLGRGPEGGALLGLDRAGLVREVLRLPPPVALARRAGRSWALVRRGSAAGRAIVELWEWGRGGVLGVHPHAGPFALDAGGRPWVLVGSESGDQLLRAPDGAGVLATRGAGRPIPGRGGVWVGNRAGELFGVDARGVVRRDLGVELLGLAPGAAGPLWVGRSPRGRLLARVGGDAPWPLEPRLQWRLRRTAGLALAAGPGGGVWLCAPGRRSVELARPEGRGPRLELESSPLSLHASASGGVLALLPGAVVPIDCHGTRLPGQGGFGSCQDLVRAGPGDA